jgi:hypothetical protein
MEEKENEVVRTLHFVNEQIMHGIHQRTLTTQT